MDKVSYFNNISIATPIAQIYRRLGYRRGVTDIRLRDEAQTQGHIAAAMSLVRLQGAALRTSILPEGAVAVRLPDGTEFAGRQLFDFLNGCDEILLMGATAGAEITAAIREDAAGRDVTRAVIFDATASESVDAALDWIMAFYNRILRREGRRLLKARFSAGYGDLVLENQRAMHRLLALDRIDVEITASCMLVPEKSATAITGISGEKS